MPVVIGYSHKRHPKPMLMKHPCAVYNTDILTYPSAAAAKLQSFQQQKLQTCMTEFPFEVIRVEG
jgi:hypothetical protein